MKEKKKFLQSFQQEDQLSLEIAIIAIMRAHRHKKANHNIIEPEQSLSHPQSSSPQPESITNEHNHNLGQSHQGFLKKQDLNNQFSQENEENRVKQNQIYVGKRFMQRKPTYENMQNFTANLVVKKKSAKRIKKPLFDSEESDGGKENKQIAQQNGKNKENNQDCLYIPAEKQERNVQTCSQALTKPEQQQKSVEKQGQQKNGKEIEEDSKIENIFEFEQKQADIQKQIGQQTKETKQSKLHIDIDVDHQLNSESKAVNQVNGHNDQNEIEMSEIKFEFKGKKNVKINQQKNTQKIIGEQNIKLFNSSKQISVCLLENIRGAKRLLYEPIGLNDRLIFTFKRVKHMFLEVFELYMEGNKCPMLYCSNKKNSIGGNYYISLTEEMNKKSQTFMGKIRGNVLGSEYCVYDSGAIPSNCVNSKDWRITLGQIKYQPNFMGLDGPRRLQVCIPKAKDMEQLQHFKYTQKQQKSLWHSQPMLKLQNKQPKWIKSNNSFGLNMGPRIKSPSIKNFILVHSNRQEEQCVRQQNLLTFGKVKQNIFSMEIRYPLSILQAFAICVTQFDRKINCQ